jgi:hypothetical protein
MFIIKIGLATYVSYTLVTGPRRMLHGPMESSGPTLRNAALCQLISSHLLDFTFILSEFELLSKLSYTFLADPFRVLCCFNIMLRDLKRSNLVFTFHYQKDVKMIKIPQTDA